MSEELLAVLDMSEDEQVRYLYLAGYHNIVDLSGPDSVISEQDENGKYIKVYHRKGSPLKFNRPALADLAFRLRNEVVREALLDEYTDALEEVRKKWYITAGINATVWTETFAMMWSKPIHWIIATLIAKGAESLKE